MWPGWNYYSQRLGLRIRCQTYHNLLDLGKVVHRVGVQSEDTKRLEGGELLRDDLSRVQDVEAKSLGLLLVDDLHIELPLGEVTRVDGVPEILTVEIGILASNVLRLIPYKASLALLGLEVPLDKLGLPLVSD